MRNLVIRSLVVLGIIIAGGAVATPDSSAAPATGHCTKFVKEGPSEARKQLCEMYYYYGTLIPECRRRASGPCYAAAAEWLGNCYAGKADPPYASTTLEGKRDG